MKQSSRNKYHSMEYQHPTKQYWQKVRLGTLGVVYSLIVTIGVVAVSLLPTIIIKYQLVSVEGMLLSGFMRGFGRVLVSIDNMKFSATILTFLFWGLIGLITYGVVMALVHLWQRAEMLEEMISEQYVHPAEFNHRHYWRSLALKEGLNSLLILGMAAAFSLVLLVLLPAATLHARAVVLESSWPLVFPAVAGVILLFIGVLGVAISIKAWRFRHLLRTGQPS